MHHRDDLALVRTAMRDRNAFDELFDRYADRIHRLARARAANETLAEALTARMLEAVFLTLGRYDGRNPLDTWVLARCQSALAAASRLPASASLSGA